jgi:hypothetical protein
MTIQATNLFQMQTYGDVQLPRCRQKANYNKNVQLGFSDGLTTEPSIEKTQASGVQASALQRVRAVESRDENGDG